jgi:hypothetical protein
VADAGDGGTAGDVVEAPVGRGVADGADGASDPGAIAEGDVVVNDDAEGTEGDGVVTGARLVDDVQATPTRATTIAAACRENEERIGGSLRTVYSTETFGRRLRAAPETCRRADTSVHRWPAVTTRVSRDLSHGPGESRRAAGAIASASPQAALPPAVG